MKNYNCGAKKSKKSIITLFVLCAVLMMSLVGCGSKYEVDGDYHITYYQKNGSDVTRAAQRNMSVEIKDSEVRIGGYPKFKLSINGKKVKLESEYAVFTGTYDNKHKRFSVGGTDNQGVECIIEFEKGSDQ